MPLKETTTRKFDFEKHRPNTGKSLGEGYKRYCDRLNQENAKRALSGLEVLSSDIPLDVPSTTFSDLPSKKLSSVLDRIK